MYNIHASLRKWCTHKLKIKKKLLSIVQTPDKKRAHLIRGHFNTNHSNRPGYRVDMKFKSTLCSTFNIDRLKPILILNKNQPPNPTPNSPTPQPQRQGITFSRLKHVGSWSNFQVIFHLINQHDLWCQRWPYPPSLQSETLNVLQVRNLGHI